MSLDNWAYAYGAPKARGIMRQQPEDFFVSEQLGFEPDGQGEHLFLRIRKRRLNTHQVAKKLAQWAEVENKAVGYAGLKDRNAVTEQWFSVQLPGREHPDFAGLEDDSLEVLQHVRHGKKLKIGALQGNHFRLVVRQLTDAGELEQRLALVAAGGVPNYFGQQRFGRDGNNVEMAKLMFGGKRIKNRDKRSLYLSAARSFLFNLTISERIAAGMIAGPMAGDALMLSGSRSFFGAEQLDETLMARFAEGDVMLSGPLWGRGASAATGEAQVFEQAALAEQDELKVGLEKAGLKQERRALLLMPQEFQWQRTGDELVLNFFLPAGSYATSVLRELGQFSEPESAHAEG